MATADQTQTLFPVVHYTKAQQKILTDNECYDKAGFTYKTTGLNAQYGTVFWWKGVGGSAQLKYYDKALVIYWITDPYAVTTWHLFPDLRRPDALQDDGVFVAGWQWNSSLAAAWDEDAGQFNLAYLDTLEGWDWGFYEASIVP